jgi:F0F1-type ATP synthase beta subunit
MVGAAEPYFVAERWTKLPGTTVSLAESLQTYSDILGGRYDDLPTDAFYFIGDIAEARGNVGRTLSFGPVTWPPPAQ